MHKPIDFEDCNATGQQVLFPCAYCDLALPKFYQGDIQTRAHGWIIRRSKTFHLKVKCKSKKAKGVNLTQYWLDFLEET